MSERPRVTVVICSHNGGPRLPTALNSLATQSLKPEAFEIVVVDNASTDNTRTVVESHQKHFPNLHYVREDRLGLSLARNTGLRSARADIVAFLDDDAVACTAWAATILDAFNEFDCAVVCGPVDPIWPAARPDWLDDDLLSVYSIVSWGTVARPLCDNEWVVGTNMAVSRSVLAGQEFDARLGRRGANLVSDEEADLVDRLRQRGHQIIYHPVARVAHHIDAERLTRRWYLRRMYWQGFSTGLRTPRSDAVTLYVLNRLKEVGDTLIRPQITYVSGKSRLRRLGHATEQIGKIRGRLAR